MSAKIIVNNLSGKSIEYTKQVTNYNSYPKYPETQTSNGTIGNNSNTISTNESNATLSVTFKKVKVEKYQTSGIYTGKDDDTWTVSATTSLGTDEVNVTISKEESKFTMKIKIPNTIISLYATYNGKRESISETKTLTNISGLTLGEVITKSGYTFAKWRLYNSKLIEDGVIVANDKNIQDEVTGSSIIIKPAQFQLYDTIEPVVSSGSSGNTSVVHDDDGKGEGTSYIVYFHKDADDTSPSQKTTDKDGKVTTSNVPSRASKDIDVPCVITSYITLNNSTKFSKIIESTDLKIRGKITYTPLGWSTKKESTEPMYSANDEITVTSNTDLYAVYSAETDKDATLGQLNAFPDLKQYYPGYKSSKSEVVWKDKYGNIITSSTIVTGDLDMYCNLEGKEYTISYNSNGGKWYNNQPLQSVLKTFGVDSILDSYGPYREAYKFAGWRDSNNTIRVSESNKFTFNSESEESINPNAKSITLYAIWEPIYNHVRMHWFKQPGVSEDKEFTEVRDYCIETISNLDGSNSLIINSVQPEGKNSDIYSFIGWWYPTENEYLIPYNWNTKDSDGYHGIFKNENTIGLTREDYYNKYYSNPYVINVKDKKISYDGSTIDIYGFWTKSGKWMCLDGMKYVKVPSMYIKIDDEWKLAEQTYVFTKGEWHSEAGFDKN